MFKAYLLWFEATSNDYFNQFKNHQNPEKLYRQLSLQHHPDRGGDHKEFVAMQNGYDKFKQKSHEPQYTTEPRNTTQSQRDIPPWQTDHRSSYNVVGKDFRNLNFCKKTIYEKALQNGLPLERWTIWAFDGMFFRGVFTVFANEPVLGFAGMAMEQWNSNGANPYETKAVFANQSNHNTLFLIRLNGKDVANQDIHFDYNGGNPGNDQELTATIRNELDNL